MKCDRHGERQRCLASNKRKSWQSCQLGLSLVNKVRGYKRMGNESETGRIYLLVFWNQDTVGIDMGMRLLCGPKYGKRPNS